MNKIFLIGTVRWDAELKFTTEKGKPYCLFYLQDDEELHRIVMYGRQAELLQPYLGEGTGVYVEGTIRKFKIGERIYSEIVARKIQLLPGAPVKWTALLAAKKKAEKEMLKKSSFQLSEPPQSSKPPPSSKKR